MPAAPLGRGLLTGPGGRGGVFDGAGLLTGPTARGSGFVTGPGREACWAGGDGRAAGADDCSADGPDFVAGLASVAVVAASGRWRRRGRSLRGRRNRGRDGCRRSGRRRAGVFSGRRCWPLFLFRRRASRSTRSRPGGCGAAWRWLCCRCRCRHRFRSGRFLAAVGRRLWARIWPPR